MKIPVIFQYISIVFRKNLINFTLDSGCRKAIRVGVNKIYTYVKIQEKPFGTYSINLVVGLCFAKDDNTNKEPVAPKQTETPSTDFDAPGTLVSTSMNANVITIVCQGSEGLCFTIHDKELTTYSRTGAPETYNVTSVTHVSGKGDNTEYIIGVE